VIICPLGGSVLGYHNHLIEGLKKHIVSYDGFSTHQS